MSTRAEQAAAKAERIRAARPQRPDAAPTGVDQSTTPTPVTPSGSGSPVQTPSRSAMVRMTVDLTPQMHADLEDWARDTARSSGRTRVTRVDVVRELVRHLLADDELAEKVRHGVIYGKQ